MKTIKSVSIIVAVSFILSSCAATYHRINPPTVNYAAHDIQDGVSISYKHGVLGEKGNKKYAKKEENSNIKLIAVKITNDTDATLNVAKDLLFYSGANQVNLMDPVEIANEIKQKSGWYYSYLALTFFNLSITKDAKTNTYPVGLILGPGITAGNVVTANKANKSLKNELYEYNILYSDIPKGETVYGLIGIRSGGYAPLTVKIKGK